MVKKHLLIFSIFLLIIFSFSFVSASKVEYNFNATYQGINIWAYDCTQSLDSLFGTDTIPPTCSGAPTSQTSNSALDTSNDVRLITSPGGTPQYIWHHFNVSVKNTNNIALINWTWEGYDDISLCGYEVYLYNFTGTDYVNFGSFTNTNDITRSFSTNNTNNYISSSNQTAILIYSDADGCDGDLFTDFVKLEITYPTVNVNLSTPLNNTNSSNKIQYFTSNFSSSDNVKLSNVTLYIWNNDSSLNGTNSTIVSGTSNSSNLSYNFLGDGTFKWNCLVNNTAGVSNWSSSNFTITIDSTPPNINIITPTNNTNSTDINLNINYTTSDTHLSNCWYSNDTYSSNTSITCGENITTITWIQGNHNLTIWVNDTFGNVNSSQVSFFIDNIPPTLEIIYPEDGGSYSTNSVSLNYTASDSGVGLSSCWYKNNTGSNITINCGTNTTINQPIDGTYTIYMWANDTLNNVVSHSHTWTISTSAPNVNLQKPDNNYWFNNQTNIYFNFTASDTNGIDTCRLYGNWTGSFILNESKTFSGDTSVNISEGFFVKNITDGFYKWGVWCNDTNNDGTFATLNRTFGIDTIYPNLNLSLPQNITYTTNQLTLNYSATDTNRNTCWYNINNTNNITLTNCNNISFTANQGGSILRLFVNDSANNVNSTNISFFVDSILPTLTITTNFSNASYLNYNNSIEFNLTIIDTNLNTCWYNINGSNQTFTCGTNLTLNVSEGLKTLIVYANDSLNNQNSSQISFTSDVTYPLIQSLTATPVGNTQNVDFSFNVTDTNYNNSFYTIFNSSGGVDSSTVENTSLTCTSGNTCSGSDTVSAFATFNLTIYSRDKSGNENSSIKSFTTTAGSGSGGGGGGNVPPNKISTVAIINPINITRSNLEKAIIYSVIRMACKNQTGCKLNQSEKSDIIKTLDSYDIIIFDTELDKWIEKYNNNELESVQMLEADIIKYNLFTGVLSVQLQKLILSPNRLDPFFAIIFFSDNFTYEIKSNKVISNFSINGELGLTAIKNSDSTILVNLKVIDKNFLTKTFLGNLEVNDVDGNTAFLPISIRTINLTGNLSLIIMSLSLMFIGLFVFFRKDIVNYSKRKFVKKT